jgi:hypothetical protein
VIIVVVIVPVVIIPPPHPATSGIPVVEQGIPEVEPHTQQSVAVNPPP